MTIYDFTGVATTTTWADSNFSQNTTNFTVGQVVATTANSAVHAVCASTGGQGEVVAKLVGKTWATTLGGRVTLNGVRGMAVTDDGIRMYIVVETGTNASKGYVWAVSNGFQRLGIINLASQIDPGTAPNAWLTTSTAATVAEGDVFEFTYNTSTGALTCKQNTTTLTTATNTTYTSGLTPGFNVESGNHGGTGITQFESIGEGASGVTVSITGNLATFATGTVATSGGATAVQYSRIKTAFGPSPAAPYNLDQFQMPIRGYSPQLPDVTVALTGNTAMFALGAVSLPAQNIAVSVTGNSATFALGSVASSISSQDVAVAITGNSATFALGFVGTSGGILVAVGSLKTIFLSDATPVPASAVFIEGTAFAQTGEMYVCNWPANSLVSYRRYFANRQDGARCIISTARVEACRQEGIALTARGEWFVSQAQYTTFLNGRPLTSLGEVSLTQLS